jgi:hypothetical protein
MVNQVDVGISMCIGAPDVLTTESLITYAFCLEAV